MVVCALVKSKSAILWPLIAAQVIVFGYFGYAKFAEPIVWIGFLPTWMNGFLGLPKETWLSVIGIAEIIIAILVLLPVRTVRRFGAGLACLHLCAILTQVGWNDIGARDLGLLLGTIALFTLLSGKE